MMPPDSGCTGESLPSTSGYRKEKTQKEGSCLVWENTLSKDLPGIESVPLFLAL